MSDEQNPEKNGKETGFGKPPAEHQFKPGCAPGPGRPQGARDKLGTAFLEALQADFEAHGTAAIQTVREDRPHEYLKVVASILPKQLSVSVDPLDEMTDADLEQRVRQFAALIGIEIRACAPAGGTGETSDESPTAH